MALWLMQGFRCFRVYGQAWFGGIHTGVREEEWRETLNKGELGLMMVMGRAW